MDRAEAQARLDRVLAFSDELAALERDGVLVPDERQRQAIHAYHARLTSDLTSRFDLDQGDAQRQMSVGMRAAAVVGAVALSASIYLFFYRIWGLLPASAQVALLVAAPILAIALTELASRVDRSGHFVLLAAGVACACVVLNVLMIGQMFAMRDSPNALAVWAAFALAIGIGYRLRLPLAAGVLLAIVFAAACMARWSGADWSEVGRQPETWLAASAVAVLVSSTGPLGLAALAPTARGVGVAAMFFALWALSINAELSALDWSPVRVKAMYQVCGFVVGGAAIVLSLRARWLEGVYLGTFSLVAFLTTKFFQWWWDWMPAYLFFMIVGIVAVTMILALRRMRGAMRMAVH